MNILRAKVNQSDGWWQLTLLDLRIVAEGDSEDAMLRDLEHSLMAEYHIALEHGNTPFLRLFDPDCPEDVRKSWEEGGKSLRILNLTKEVKAALAAVFRSPVIGDFLPMTYGNTAHAA